MGGFFRRSANEKGLGRAMRLSLMLSAMAVLTIGSACRRDAPQSIRIAPDESITVAQYIEAGAPATDREWSSSDYKQLSDVLQAVAAKNPRSLPRFESPRSGPLMNRAVSEENFRFADARLLSLETRISEALALQQNLMGILRTYVDATNKGESFDRELVELIIFSAKGALKTWSLADEVAATLTPEQMRARESGLARMRSGTAQMINGFLATFGETNAYRASELQRLAGAFEVILPAMLRRVGPESGREARLRLRSLAEKTGDRQLADSLRDLAEVVESSDAVPPVNG